MTKKAALFLTVLTLVAGLFAGCSEDADITVPNGIYFVADGVQYAYTNDAICNNYTEDTTLIASSADNMASMQIDFPGSTTGTFTETNGMATWNVNRDLSIAGPDFIIIKSRGLMPTIGKLTLNVLKYGAEGQTVTGNFSGELITESGSTNTITSGAFSLPVTNTPPPEPF